jgi:MraZ protein
MFDFMLGNVRHQLDEKDRMRIPAKYREALGSVSYILPGRKVDGNHCCLYVIPYDKFEKVFAKLDTDELYGGDEKVDAATTILGAAEKLTEDQQGRVRLSKALCSCASIEKDLVFVGKGTYLELWSAEVWDERYSILNKSNLDKVLDNLKKHGV